MKINKMFAKDIDRDIQGVIKVGQDKDENIRQELEEYVVTRELKRHFADFFESYKKGINGSTDKMGVWISGFFGSGKSHFLKILSYLLENREVEGKNAFQYFLDDEKIEDPKVLENIKLAADTRTDVVLFNIDSKSESSGIKGKDSILNVFLRVFNEMLGFSTDPHLADLERQMLEDGVYQDFKDKYKETHDLDWIENRHKFKFHKDKVIQVISEMEIMSKESAREWSSTTTKPYEISIDRFAVMVKEYLDKKQENHHIVFLVDEIGQYIGNDTDLMLNLQTITEDLGTACGGKAWIVVTSQQDIDSITEVVGEDFSKIQGRFDTRLSLTSANVDEVIKLRILEKTPTANETLSILYENNETIIKNLIIFNDGIDKKLYDNGDNFCEIYPFIPYQFNLLGNVLTSIRENGASGKHLADGERSMLALFKESAEQLKDKEAGEIVQFSMFYKGLNKFLDHSHSAVITKALDNAYINPSKDEDEDNFNIKVLKTLFLIKYVKEIESNLENITTLMVSNIGNDRIELRDDVEKALKILVEQTLVQRNGDLYIFLTNEEQEVNRLINKQDIETQAITKRIAELIFTDILTEDKVKYGKSGKGYNFGFNRLIDGEPYKANQSFDIGIDIITPYSEKNRVESVLTMISKSTNIIYIDLPKSKDFIDELRTEMRIEKYLQLSTSSNIPKIEEIRNLKRSDMKEHKNRAKSYLMDSLRDVDFYLSGDKIEAESSNFNFGVQNSLERAIEIVYHKLDYIDTAMDLEDIKKLFKSKEERMVQLDHHETPNKNAVIEVLDYIKVRTKNHSKIAIKEIIDKFSKAPFGFLDGDIKWIISKLFLDGNINFNLNGASVSLLNETEEEIINYITKRQYAEKLLIEEKEIIEEKYIKSLKNISTTLFNRDVPSEDTDIMIRSFNESSKNLQQELEALKTNYNRGIYPGEQVIDDGIKLMNSTDSIKISLDIFKELNKNEDDYLDFEEDFGPIKSFFKGNQKNIWEKTQQYASTYDESKSFILNEEIENITENMKNILSMSSPYNRIQDLPDLNDEFITLYNDILDEELHPVKTEIEKAEQRIIEELEKTELENKLGERYRKSFKDLMDRADSCDNVAKINGFKIEADTLKMRYLKEISDELEKSKTPIIGGGETGTGSTTTQSVKPIKRRKNISIKDVNPSNSWRIENQADLQKYIDELKNSLEKELGENIILNIEF